MQLVVTVAEQVGTVVMAPVGSVSFSVYPVMQPDVTVDEHGT